MILAKEQITKVLFRCAGWSAPLFANPQTGFPITGPFDMRFIPITGLSGFIRVREMSGKFKFFQGQGIVREFYVVSVKNGYLLKCQGNVRDFIISSLYQMMRSRKLLGQFD